jgi:hypothetical protein
LFNIGPFGKNVSKRFFSETKLPRNDHWKVLCFSSVNMPNTTKQVRNLTPTLTIRDQRLSRACIVHLVTKFVKGATSGTGTAYPFVAPEFTPGFSYFIFSFICMFCNKWSIPMVIYDTYIP